MKKITVVVFLGVMLCCGIAKEAFGGLSVVPGIIEIVANRGDESAGVCKVINTGTEKTHVTVQAEDWRKGFKGTRGGSVAGWLKIEPLVMDLEPGKSGDFKYQIKVAANAEGENAAQIFFTEMTNGGGTQIQTRVGSIIYVTVRNTIRLECEIMDLKVAMNRDGKSSTASGQVAMKNSGNVHIRPTGDIKIFDGKGAFVMAIVLNTGWGILPGEDYTYAGTGRAPALKAGRYKAVANIEIGKLFKQKKTYTKEIFVDVR